MANSETDPSLGCYSSTAGSVEHDDSSIGESMMHVRLLMQGISGGLRKAEKLEGLLNQEAAVTDLGALIIAREATFKPPSAA